MEADSTSLRRDRILFYTGLMLLLIGLPGFIMGSWMHDIMRIPLVNNAYDAWGWLNQTAALLGLFMTVFGVIFLVLSLRGGIVDYADVAEDSGGP